MSIITIQEGIKAAVLVFAVYWGTHRTSNMKNNNICFLRILRLELLSLQMMITQQVVIIELLRHFATREITTLCDSEMDRF